jgi:hypothetical protein
MSETGFLVTRRKRVGTMLANSAGLGDCAEVYYTHADAEQARECMTCPRDWDVVEVIVAARTGGDAADERSGA